MIFLFKIIFTVVFAALFFLWSGGFSIEAPETEIELQKLEETNETVEIVVESKKETIAEPEVIKTEPLRVIKEEIKIDNSILTVGGIVSWTNFFRQTNGLPALKENFVLTSVAFLKMEDILQRQYFEHTSPTGEGAGDLTKQAGYKFVLVGENLAMGDFIDDEDVVKAWMNSPGHRANILKPSYTEIGVAAKKGFFNGREVWVSVQIFAVPLSFCESPEEEFLSKIESQKAQLKSNKEHLDLLRGIIEEEKYQTREEYEKLVAEYNSLVPAYNFLSQNIKNLIEEYNSKAALFNQCVDSIP